MSTTIDEKVVSMQFDNKQFQNGANETINTLDKLKETLNKDVGSNSFDQLDRAAKSVDFSSIQAGVEALSDRFSTLGIVGMTVIQDITSAITNKLGSALSAAMDKIVQGGITRAMNIENAHFQLQGLIDDEKEVQAIMTDASNSVDGTAYSYDSAAKAASMFAATGMTSGIELQNALKGLAGVAATTNSDYDSMAQIFTTVAGQGRVMGDQLNQLASRGLNAAASLANYFNGVSKGEIDATDAVKQQIQAMAESITMTEEQVAAKKESLEAEYEMEQEAVNNEIQLKKKAYAKEYEDLRESLNDQYNAKKKQLDEDYKALSKALDKEIQAAKEANEAQIEEANKAYESNVEEYKKSTEERVKLINQEYETNIKAIEDSKKKKLEAIQEEIDALTAEYQEAIKLIDEERDTRISVLEEEINTVTEEYGKSIELIEEERDTKLKALEERSEAINKEYEEESEINEKRLEEAKKAYEDNVEAYKKATDERISLIDKEYTENLKLIDEEKYNRLKAIDDQIEAINKQTEEEDKARKKAEQQQKIADLQEAIEQAKNDEARLKAEKNLADYMDKLAQEEIREQRKAGIERLKEEKNQIKEEAEQRKDAEKEKRTAAINSIKETSQATLTAMRDSYNEEVKAVKEHQQELNDQRKANLKSVQEESKALKEETEERKKTLQKQVTDTIETLKEEERVAKEEAEILKEVAKEKVTAAIESLKAEENVIIEEAELKKQAAKEQKDEAVNAVNEESKATLAAMKESHTAEIKAMRASQAEQLEAMKESKSAQLESLKESQNKELTEYKKGQNDQLEALKEKQDEELRLYQKGLNNRLSALKESIKQEEKALKAGSGALEITEADIRDLVSKGMVSFDIFSEAMATTFGEHAKDANKTFTGAMANIGAALARTGALFVSPLIKQEGPMVEMFNAVRVKINEMNKALTPFAESVTTKILDTIPKVTEIINNLSFAILDEEGNFVKNGPIMENFFKIIDIGKNIFEGLLSVLKPIKEAITETFDFKSINISGFIDIIYDLTSKMKLNEKQSENVKNAFKGIFDVIQLLLDGITYLVDKLFNLNTGMTDVEKPTRSFSDVIFGLIGRIGSALSYLSEFIRALVTGKSDVEIFSKVSEKLSGVFEFLSGIWSGVLRVFDPLIRKLKDLGSALLNAAKSTDPLKAFFTVLNGSLFAGILSGIKDIITNFGKSTKTVSNFFTNINGILTGVKTYLKALTTEVQSKALKEIATAVLMLAGAIFLISSIDAYALTRSMIAITALLREVTGVFLLLQEFSKSAPTVGNQINSFLGKLGTASLAVSLVAVAGAVIMLAGAVKMLSGLSWEEIGKGLAGVSGLLLELGIFTKMVGGEEKLTAIGFGLLLVSASVIVLYEAVKGFADLSWEEIGKGLAGVGGVLLELAGFTMLAGGAKNMISIGVSMVLLGAALNIVYDAFVGFAQLDWEEILKGAVAMGTALTEMVLALNFTPPSAILSGGAFWILAQALQEVQPAFEAFGKMSWSEVGRAATGMGSALTEMTLALDFATPISILSGGGLAVLAKALQEVQPAFEAFGKMSWSEVGRAATGMGSALTEMTLALDFTTPISILSGGGLAVLAKALDDIAPAFKEFGKMSWDQVKRAAVGLGAALTEMTLALDFTLPGSILSGGALWDLADTVTKIAPAFKSLGQMSWDEIKRGATGLLAVMGELSGIEAVIGIFSGPIVIGAAAFEAAVLSLYTASTMLPGMVRNIKDAIEIINKLDYSDFQNGLKRIGEALETMGDSLDHFGLFAPLGAKAMKTLAEGIETLTGPMVIFSNMNPIQLSTAFIVLGNGISRFGESLDSFGLLSGIGADAMYKVGGAIEKLAPAMVQLESLNPIELSLDLSILARAFKAFGESLEGFGLLDTIKTDAIVDMAEAVSLLAPALVELSDIPAEDLSTALDSLGKAFETFGTAIENTRFWGAKSRAEGIGALIDNIAKLAEVLPAFIELDKEDVRYALETLGPAFQSFGTALTNTPFWGSTSRAEGIGALIDNISKLSAVLPGFIEIPSEDARTALETLAIGFTGFANALDEAPFWGVKDKGAAISVLCNSITSLTNGLKEFLKIEAKTETIKSAFETIAYGFSTFGKSLKSAPFWNPEDRGAAISILCNSIESLAEGVSGFLDLIKLSDAETVESALDIIGKAFKSFGEAIKAAPLWNAKTRAEGIGLLVSYIDDLADGVKKICDIESGDAESVLETLGNAFESFGTAISESPLFKSETRAKSIGIVVGHIEDLVEPLQALSDIETDILESVFTGLVGLLTGMGEALDNFHWSGDKVTQFGSFITTINGFGNIDTTKLFNAVNELDRVIKSCKAASEINVASLNSFSVALGNMATVGLQTFLDVFTNSTNTIESTVTKFIQQVANSLNEKRVNLKPSGILATSSYLGGFSESSVETSISTAVSKFISNITAEFRTQANRRTYNDTGGDSAKSYLSGFVDSAIMASITFETSKFVDNIVSVFLSSSILGKYKDSGSKSASSFLHGFVDNSVASEIASTVTNFINGILSAFNSTRVTDDLKTAGINAISSYLRGFTDSKVTGDLNIAVNGLIDSIGEKFNNSSNLIRGYGNDISKFLSEGIDNGRHFVEDSGRRLGDAAHGDVNSLAELMKNAGAWAVWGFTAGISDNLNSAEDAGRRLGDAAYEAARRALDEHSPSKKMRSVGSFAAEGFVNGLQSWISKVFDAGSLLGDNLTDGLTNSIDDINNMIQNGSEFNPVISPIINIDKLKEQANEIGGLLDLSTPVDLANKVNMSFTGGLKDLFEELGTSFPETSNEDVVDELKKLQESFIRTMDEIGRLKIVLDTGAMVGELVNPIDKALGYNAVLNERGVRR